MMETYTLFSWTLAFRGRALNMIDLQRAHRKTPAKESRSRFPRITLNHHRSILPLNRDTPAARRVTRWQRTAFVLVHVVAARFTCANGRLDLIDLGDVDYGVRVFADAEHDHPQRMPEPCPRVATLGPAGFISDNAYLQASALRPDWHSRIIRGSGCYHHRGAKNRSQDAGEGILRPAKVSFGRQPTSTCEGCDADGNKRRAKSDEDRPPRIA
jgi:hypothetical protein